MGRTRITRSGERIQNVRSGRNERREEHSKHRPNPRRGVSQVPRDQAESSVPSQVKALNVYRRQILAEATKLGLLSNTSDYEVLAKDLQDRLATEIKQIPGANVMQALAAEQAHKDALDTVMLMMIRIQARNKCEVLRRKLLKAINYGGPLSVLILDKLRIDTTVVTDSRFTPAKCDARSAHFQAVISALF